MSAGCGGTPPQSKEYKEEVRGQASLRLCSGQRCRRDRMRGAVSTATPGGCAREVVGMCQRPLPPAASSAALSGMWPQAYGWHALKRSGNVLRCAQLELPHEVTHGMRRRPTGMCSSCRSKHGPAR